MLFKGEHTTFYITSDVCIVTLVYSFCTYNSPIMHTTHEVNLKLYNLET